MTELNDHSIRAHALLSASSAARWLACPPSAELASRYPSKDTAYTREGTLAHEVAEAMASGRSIPADTDPEMVRHAEAYCNYIQSLATDDTAILLEAPVSFSKWVPGGFGTADCILLSGTRMEVIDYKYGRGVEVSAEENPQMMLYGLGALDEYGILLSDVQTVRLHIFQPRLDHVSCWEISTEDLLVWAEEVVKPTAEQAAKGAGNMAAGNHCRFCPHAGQCLHLAMTCIQAVAVDKTIAPPPHTLSPMVISEMLKLEPIISMWLKALKTQAQETLMSGGEIPGYKVVEGKLGNRKWTDEIAVAQVLTAQGLSKEDFTTISLLSPAEMDKALGKKRAAELLGGLVSRAPGAPTVVPVSDKRKPLDITADFENLDKE